MLLKLKVELAALSLEPSPSITNCQTTIYKIIKSYFV